MENLESIVYAPCWLSQALLKLNRKLQPMVDGINANREKWQELCFTSQQMCRVSSSSQSTDPGQNTESSDEADTTEQPETTDKV